MTGSFDVITIGGGPGGYVAAIRAAQLGLSSACVEAEELGGVCLNWGCIPNGVLLHYAGLVSDIQLHGRELGLRFEGLETDYSVAVARSRRVVRRLVGGVGHLFKKYGVTHIRGYGRLADANTVEVDGSRYRARHIILATGATWNRPEDVGAEGEVDGERIVAYRQGVVQTEVPRSVIVVGAGIVGVEFSHTYNAYGAEVTLVERASQILPLDDTEVAEGLERVFRKRGIQVRKDSALRKVERVGERVRVTIAPAAGGEAETLEADQVLLALGIRPNSSGMGLEQLGIETSHRGGVIIDEALRTRVPHILAVGDLTGKRALASVASHMGLAAAETIAGLPPQRLDYRMMPRISYCKPQGASVGYTEAELQELNIPYRVGRFPLAGNGKALGMNESDGFVKLLVHQKEGELLGMHVLAPEAAELMAEFTLARELEGTPAALFNAVHPHPTLSEAIAEAALDVEGRMLNY
jgi:dihydrolipoamide dehydrogenase